MMRQRGAKRVEGVDRAPWVERQASLAAPLSVWALVSTLVLITRGTGLLAVSVAGSLLALVSFPGAFIWELVKSNTGIDSRIEQFAFIVAASVGINTLIMFFLGLIGQINFMSVFLTSAILNVSICSLSSRIHRTRIIRTRMVKFSGLDAALATIPGVILVFYFFNAFAFPFTAWDAIASYNRWAIVIASAGTVAGVGTSGFSLYPLGISLSYAWVYVLSGQVLARAAHGLSPIFGLIALAYCFLLAKEIHSNGAFAVLLTLLLPLVGAYFISGYADLPSAGFATASAFYLIRNLRHGKTVDLFLVGVMAGLSLWMKPTGFYLLLVTPLAYLAASGVTRSGKQLVVMMLGEIAVLPWVLYALVSHGAGRYFADVLALSSNPGFWAGRQNLTLIVRLEQAAFVLLTPVRAAPVVFVTFAGLLYMIVRNRLIRGVAICVASFILIWSVFFSYDGRYLITFWPTAAAFGSAAVVKWFQFLRAKCEPVRTMLHLRYVWPQMLSCLLLILALTPATLLVIAGAIQGPGPTLSWSISHPLASDDEKLLVALGPFYDVVVFFKSDPHIYSASVVSMDARYAGILPNATFAWPSTTNDIRGYRFLIVPSFAFRMSFWNTTPLANLTRSNSLSLRLIYQTNWEQGLEGYGDGYRVFEITTA